MGGGRSLRWHGVAWLMLSDIVGTSVLTFSGVTADLGWLLTAAFILAFCPLCLYVSLAMSRTRLLLLASQKGCPVGTMGEVARAAFSSDSAGRAVEFAVYGTTFLGQASYLLVLGTSIQQALSGLYSPCLYTASAAGCALLLPAICLMRSLGESVWLCFANTLIIAAVIVFAVRGVADEASRSGAPLPPVYAVSPGLTMARLMGAATNVLYSFAGQWMYFELMETMEDPSQFPMTFAVVGPAMAAMYLAVALLGYFSGARGNDLLSSVPPGPLLRALGAMLFAHVAVVYLIKSVVLARCVHRLVSPRTVDSRSWRSYRTHALIGGAMLAVGYVIANSIPFFPQLLGLIGGLCAGPTNFLLPLALYLAALRRHGGAGGGGGSPSLSHDGEDPYMPAELSKRRRQAASVVGLASTAARLLPPWEFALVAVITAGTVLTMVVGVSAQLAEIARLHRDVGAPFSCHPYAWGGGANGTVPASAATTPGLGLP